MIRRRTALGFMGAMLGSASVLAAPDSPPSKQGPKRRGPSFDAANQDQLSMAFRKLAYSMDDRVTWWWLHGTRYGIVGSVATPFWEMHVATWFRTRDLADGRYEVTSAGANFYTLPGETQLLERFANPYTGKSVDVPYGTPKATVTVHDRKGGSPFAPGAIPGMNISRSKTDIGPAWIEGDEVRVRGDVMVHAQPNDPSRPPFTVNDWSTYVGRLADVTDPRVRNAPASQAFNDILTFPAWLQMGDQPGAYFSRCYGRKVFSYGAMPALWQRLFEGRFPQIAKDPAAVLGR